MVQIDIQMPSDCYSCWVRKNMGCKIANDSGWLNNKRDDNCPLKEQKTTFEKDGHHVRCLNCGEYWCDTDREGNPFPMNFCPNCGNCCFRIDEG